ncbi:protein neprosin-like [Lycium barbarum]|uniref:protein neprosin-like n=1 Tax=Lycium barbarum TaxID=112863 RepID=UPI00293E6C1C|nr:protein neprosin-like [Lycium barbarum]
MSGICTSNNKIPVDMAFNGVSRRGDKISWEFRMNIDRELVKGNWWLILGKSNIQVGFWPQNIFTSLRSFADNVEWGGVTYNPPGVPEPPMGSSFFPIGRTNYDAYCRRFIVVNEKGETIDVDKTTIYVDDPNLYRVRDYPQPDQHLVLYGDLERAEKSKLVT